MGSYLLTFSNGWKAEKKAVGECLTTDVSLIFRSGNVPAERY
jgi:hypothetical protein